MLKLILIFSLLILVTKAAANEDYIINIHVYYESLCPDSQRFINNQLSSVFTTNLNEITNIILIPFGKASVWSFLIVIFEHLLI